MTGDHRPDPNDDVSHDDASVTRRALIAATGVAATTTAAGCVSTPIDLARTPATESGLEHVVDASWLNDNLSEVEVIDVRDADEYRSEHIHSAAHADWEELRGLEETDDGVLPDIDRTATHAGNIGIEPDDDVVVYGGSVGQRVTQAMYALVAAGHQGDVLALDGGFGRWVGRVGTGRKTPEPTTYEPTLNTDVFVTRTWVRDRLEEIADGEIGLLDVRPAEEFTGEAAARASVEAGDYARHGHIAGATNVAWQGNTVSGHLDEPDSLYEIYLDRADLELDQTVVVYCITGEFASNTWFTLRALGFEDVRIYEGGWDEWGNLDEDLWDSHPMETRSEAVVETDDEEDGADQDAFSC